MPSPLDYRRSSPAPDHWQWRRVTELVGAWCVALTIYFGFLSFVLSHKLGEPTAAYKQFMRSMQAHAATRPVGAVFQCPQFGGQMFAPRPIFRLYTTYLAIGFAGAAIALFYLCKHRPRDGGI